MDNPSKGYAICYYTQEEELWWITDDGPFRDDSSDEGIPPVKTMLFKTCGLAIGYWLTFYCDTPITMVSFNLI